MSRKITTKTQSAEKTAEELSTPEQTEQPMTTQEQAEQTEQTTATQDTVITDATTEAPTTQESNEEESSEAGVVATGSDQPIDGSATPDSSTPETSADEPTSEAPTPKKMKRPVVQKARCIIMLDRDTVEVLDSFKLPRSSVGRAVIAGCQEFLASFEGELTEDQLTAKLREKLS